MAALILRNLLEVSILVLKDIEWFSLPDRTSRGYRATGTGTPCGKSGIATGGFCIAASLAAPSKVQRRAFEFVCDRRSVKSLFIDQENNSSIVLLYARAALALELNERYISCEVRVTDIDVTWNDGIEDLLRIGLTARILSGVAVLTVGSAMVKRKPRSNYLRVEKPGTTGLRDRHHAGLGSRWRRSEPVGALELPVAHLNAPRHVERHRSA